MLLYIWVDARDTVQSLSHVQLFVTPWTEACQASLSITNSWNLFKLMSIKSMMPSNHLILCCPLLLLPSIFPSIRVFSDESVLHIRWPKYWGFSFFNVFLAFSMIQWMLAIGSLVPLPFLKPAWTSRSSQFMYCWIFHIFFNCLENFEHYFTSVWNECNCAVVWAFFFFFFNFILFLSFT